MCSVVQRPDHRKKRYTATLSPKYAGILCLKPLLAANTRPGQDSLFQNTARLSRGLQIPTPHHLPPWPAARARVLAQGAVARALARARPSTRATQPAPRRVRRQMPASMRHYFRLLRHNNNMMTTQAKPHRLAPLLMGPRSAARRPGEGGVPWRARGRRGLGELQHDRQQGHAGGSARRRWTP